ncbi:MAG: class I SAM-dependent methyltransferase [Nocardioides sp.]
MPPSSASEPEESLGFDEVWNRIQPIPGWLKEAQARLLWDAATALPTGSVVLEIGSHQGRSTVVLGEAVRPRGGTVIAVDPFVDGVMFGGASTRAKFESNVMAFDLGDIVELVPDYSTKLRRGWDRPFAMLYIDGKHDYWTVSDDLRWSVHLPPGAAVIVHDSFSSIGVTLGLLRHVFLSRTVAYEGRSDSQAMFRVRRPTRADRVALLRQLPWWLRNVGLKVLLRLRLRAVARLLGHDSVYDPY